jgi:hypothetical protein
MQQSKIEKYLKLKRRFPDLVKISQDEFLRLSDAEILAGEVSANLAVANGELIDQSRVQRLNGKGKSLIQQACELRGWDNPNQEENENVAAGKIRFK